MVKMERSWVRKMNKTEDKRLRCYQKKFGEEVMDYLCFPNLEKISFVSHLFSTRTGGVSEGAIGRLNLSYAREENRANVDENFRRVASVLESDISNMVCTDQTHTNNVRIVGKNDAGKGTIRQRDYENIDGIITNEPGIVLSAFFADCVPIYVVDPVHKAIGLAHSGWRGTVQKISAKMLNEMHKHYGTNPEDCVCAVGPSICRECYEVSEDVAQEFYKLFGEEPATCKEEADREQKVLYRKEDGKYQLDLWLANEKILILAGVLKKNICVTDLCTCCNSKLLFSHRASHGIRGNLGAFLMINEED